MVVGSDVGEGTLNSFVETEHDLDGIHRRLLFVAAESLLILVCVMGGSRWHGRRHGSQLSLLKDGGERSMTRFFLPTLSC